MSSFFLPSRKFSTFDLYVQYRINRHGGINDDSQALFICLGLIVLKLPVMAVTNRADILDPALMRSGRLDRKIEFPHPTEEARAQIMQVGFYHCSCFVITFALG